MFGIQARNPGGAGPIDTFRSVARKLWRQPPQRNYAWGFTVLLVCFASLLLEGRAMYFDTSADFLRSSVFLGMRGTQAPPVADILALRATCRAGRDLVDESTFWPRLHQRAAGTTVALPPGAAKETYLTLSKYRAEQKWRKATTHDPLPHLGKALEHACMTAFAAAQFPALPAALMMSPVHGCLSGAVLGSLGVFFAGLAASRRLHHRPGLRALSVAGAVACLPGVVATAALIGAVAEPPVVLATSLGAPAYFGSNAVARLVRAIAIPGRLLFDPHVRVLLRENLRDFWRAPARP